MDVESAFSAYSKNKYLINNIENTATKMKTHTKSPSKVQQIIEKRKREMLIDQEMDLDSSISPPVVAKKKIKLNNSVEKKEAKISKAKKSAKEIINGKKNVVDEYGSDGNIFDGVSPIKAIAKAKKTPKIKMDFNFPSGDNNLKKTPTPKKPKSEEKIRRSKSVDNSQIDSNKSLQDFLSSLISDDEDGSEIMEIMTEIKKEKENKEGHVSSEATKKAAKKSPKKKIDKVVAAKPISPEKKAPSSPVAQKKKKDNKVVEAKQDTSITKPKTPKKTPLKSKSETDSTTPKAKVAKKKSAPTISTPKIEESKSKPKNIIDETSSIIEGENLFKWLIHPVALKDFYSQNWERRPLHIARGCPTYYKNLISSVGIDKMLRDERIEFTKNIDITSYINGVRQTHNPPGRACPSKVWDFYSNGCSIRLLNPQTYVHKLNLLCATMQEYFSCMVGANSYLTPPESQGFAPHYDDIEAFVIQIEGKKHWKLYAPRTPSETLPRHSSPNFTDADIGEPIMDITLCPGDLLYFPRGTIHQANTVPGEHSLHITLSVYQKHSWGDLLELLMPGMLATAIEEDVSFREGLPLDLSRNVGLIYSDRPSERRTAILKKIKELIEKMINYAPYDAAVDQLFKQYQHNALPPVLTPQQLSCTVFGDGEIMNANGKVSNHVEFSPTTRVRLLRANILRMIMEEETIRLYYHIDNLKEYQGVELQYVEIDETQAPAVEQLVTTYPKYVSVSDLEIKGDDNKLKFAEDLWTRGLLMTALPLENIDDD